MQLNQTSEQVSLASSATEQLAFCPICDCKVSTEGAGCAECDNWYHYGCVNLSTETVSKTFKDTEYVCDLCNDNMLYDSSQTVLDPDQSEQTGICTQEGSPVAQAEAQVAGNCTEQQIAKTMSVTGAGSMAHSQTQT